MSRRKAGPAAPEPASDAADAAAEVAPFLRWVGGKRQIVRRLVEFAPSDAAQRRYIEPFLGAGSLFFALTPQQAVLGDANSHLVSCYRAVRDHAAQVAAGLRRHAAAHSEDHYYRVRALYNRSPASPARAAQFIYLNQACYNGVFRVNTKGQFNVPCGSREPNLPASDDLERVARHLRPAKLVVGDFATTLASAQRGDFVYLDPPYPPLNGTAYFAHYTMDRFGDEDQERLATLVRQLDERGCAVMVSNADRKSVRALYAGFAIRRLSVTRYVTCKKKRHRVREVVITNY